MTEQEKTDMENHGGQSDQMIGILLSSGDGTVTAVSANGSTRVLNPGDPIMAGETLQSSASAEALIAFADGSTRRLPAGASIELTTQNYQQLALTETPEGDSDVPDFAELLAALSEGRDISELLDETAAGEQGANGDEIGQGVRFERVEQSAKPEVGIDPDTSFSSPDADQNFVQQAVVNLDGTVTLGDVTANEDQTITYTASVDNAPQDSDLVITLSNGVIITIPVGQTSGSATQAAQGDDPYIDAESFTVSIVSTSGGGYESLNISDTAQVSINDTIDTTAVTLSSATVAEGSETATITASVNNAPQDSDLVLTLDTGDTITILAGQTSGSTEVVINNGEDPYLDASNFDVAITNASGGNYENLDTSDTATVIVEDTIDTTTVTLTGETVDEGSGTATITASVNNAPQGSDLVLTLDTGDTITILAGQTSGSTEVAINNGEDPYLDASNFDVAISNASGGNYESLDTSDTATVVVDDTIDTTTVTLTGETVDEGSGTATITASVNNAPQGSDLVLTLDTGDTITILAGQTSGSTEVAINNGEDPYLDASNFDVAITNASGGNYENLDTSDTATVVVDDTIDTTTVTLTGETVDEGSGTAIITASVNNAPQGSDLVLTLNTGDTITILAGQTSGSTQVQINNDDDPYIGPSTFDVAVTDANGGNYEDLDTSDIATVVVEDTIDTTTVTLTGETVDEGSDTATITATVDNPPLDTDLVLTLDTGDTITILAGQTSGSTEVAINNGEDPYLDASNFDVAITNASGGNYENLDTSDTATVIVEDTIDTTTVTLTGETVNEGSGTATITASVNNAPQGSDLVLTLDTGDTITILAGQTSGSTEVAINNGEDPYLDASNFDVAITNASGGNYENLDTSDTASVVVEDTIDTTTVTLTGETVNEGVGTATITASVNNAPQGSDLVLTLDTGDTITILAGQTSGSTEVAINNGEDPYLDASNFDVAITNASGGNYENLDTSDTASVVVEDTIDTTTVTLTGETVNEGVGTATITASVNNAPQGSDLVLTLDTGDTITILAGQTSGSTEVAINNGEDPYLDASNFDVAIANASGGNYENLDTSNTATVVIEDTIDTTTVTLTGETVNEGSGTATITASVNNAPQGSDLVLTLDTGDTITILAGQTSGSTEVAINNGEDPYLDASNFDVAIANASGGNYENLDTSDTASVVVEDTIDTTTVTLTGETVNEGAGTATITASVNNAPQGSDLVLTLDTGDTITILAGQTSGSTEVAINNGEDPYLDASNFDVAITNATGGNYENLDTSDTASVIVEDTTDITTVTLTAPVDVDENATSVTFTVDVDNVPQSDLDLTVDVNGVERTVTILSGESSATFDVDVRTDDFYLQGTDTITATVTGASGGNYESLDFSGATDNVDVVDDNDVTKIFIEDVTVEEGSTTATIEASVENAPQGTPLVVTLSNGATITFAVGATTATSTNFSVGGEGQTVVSITNTSGGNYEALDDSDTAVVTVDNLPPTSADYTVLLDEDTVYHFDGSEFAFNDTAGDSLASITIKSLPSNGELTLNGVAVAVNDVILAADLNKLEFTPVKDAAGNDYASFDFTVSDGTESSAQHTVTIDVDPVADLPTINAPQIATNGFAYSVATSKTTGDSTLIRIDLDTGTQEQVGSVTFGNKDVLDIEALSADPSDENILYGFVNTGGARILVKINIELVDAGAPGAVTQLGSFSDTTSEMGSTFANGVMYVFTKNGSNSTLYSVDKETGAFANLGNLAGHNITALTFDISTSTFYAINSNGKVLIIEGILEGGPLSATPLLHNGDQNTPVVVSGAVESLAYSQNGKLFAIDRVNGTVFEIDTNDGMVSSLFTLNVSDFQGDGIEALAITVSGNTVINDGDQFGITLSGQFGDFTDGSEEHYFLVKLPSTDWLTGGTNAEIVIDPNGVPAGTYAKVPVDGLLDNDGNALATLILTAPSNNTEGVDIRSFDVYAVASENDPDNLDSSDDLAIVQGETVEIQVLNGDSVFRGTGDTDDTLTGTSGVDLLYGNGGDDTMTGGAGADLFVWLSGDEGTNAMPAEDQITDFSTANGDVLHLSNLLQGEESGDLADYLSFDFSGGNTVISVSVHGDGNIEQKITINEDLSATYGTTDPATIIANLTAGGDPNLVVDQ